MSFKKTRLVSLTGKQHPALSSIDTTSPIFPKVAGAPSRSPTRYFPQKRPSKATIVFPSHFTHHWAQRSVQVPGTAARTASEIYRIKPCFASGASRRSNQTITSGPKILTNTQHLRSIAGVRSTALANGFHAFALANSFLITEFRAPKYGLWFAYGCVWAFPRRDFLLRAQRCSEAVLCIHTWVVNVTLEACLHVNQCHGRHYGYLHDGYCRTTESPRHTHRHGTSMQGGGSCFRLSTYRRFLSKVVGCSRVHVSDVPQHPSLSPQYENTTPQGLRQQLRHYLSIGGFKDEHTINVDRHTKRLSSHPCCESCVVKRRLRCTAGLPTGIFTERRSEDVMMMNHLVLL